MYRRPSSGPPIPSQDLVRPFCEFCVEVTFAGWQDEFRDLHWNSNMGTYVIGHGEHVMLVTTSKEALVVGIFHLTKIGSMGSWVLNLIWWGEKQTLFGVILFIATWNRSSQKTYIFAWHNFFCRTPFDGSIASIAIIPQTNHSTLRHISCFSGGCKHCVGSQLR
jgi:hypothetical protein